MLTYYFDRASTWLEEIGAKQGADLEMPKSSVKLLSMKVHALSFDEGETQEKKLLHVKEPRWPSVIGESLTAKFLVTIYSCSGT